MIMLAATLALALQAQTAPAEPPSYAQAGVCETVGRRVVTLVEGVERSNGASPDSQALGGQAARLVELSVVARAEARTREALTPEEVRDVDQLIADRLGAADQTQFENAVINCFVLFGIE